MNENVNTIEVTMPISKRFAIFLLVMLNAGSLSAQDSDDFERRSDHPYLLYTDANVARADGSRKFPHESRPAGHQQCVLESSQAILGQ